MVNSLRIKEAHNSDDQLQHLEWNKCVRPGHSRESSDYLEISEQFLSVLGVSGLRRDQKLGQLSQSRADHFLFFGFQRDVTWLLLLEINITILENHSQVYKPLNTKTIQGFNPSIPGL